MRTLFPRNRSATVTASKRCSTCAVDDEQLALEPNVDLLPGGNRTVRRRARHRRLVRTGPRALIRAGLSRSGPRAVGRTNIAGLSAADATRHAPVRARRGGAGAVAVRGPSLGVAAIVGGRLRPQILETILDVRVVGPVDRPFLAQLHLQIHDFVAEVVEIALQARSSIRVGAPQSGDVPACLVDLVLQALDVGGRHGLGACGQRNGHDDRKTPHTLIHAGHTNLFLFMLSILASSRRRAPCSRLASS